MKQLRYRSIFFQIVNVLRLFGLFIVYQKERVIALLKQNKFIQKWFLNKFVLNVNPHEYIDVFFTKRPKAVLTSNFKILKNFQYIFRNKQIDSSQILQLITNFSENKINFTWLLYAACLRLFYDLFLNLCFYLSS